MNWFKQFFATPFSDLWLPTIAIGVLLIALLSLHWLWLQWRVSRAESSARAATLNAAAQADAALNSHPVSYTSEREHGLSSTSPLAPDYAALSDIHALTTQKKPVLIVDFNPIDEPTKHEKSRSDAQRIEPSFARSDAVNLHQDYPHADARDQTNSTVTGESIGADLQLDRVTQVEGEVDPNCIFFNPHAATLSAKAQQSQPLTLHPQLHYQARLTWSDRVGKKVLSEVLSAHPWLHALPVVWLNDPNSERSVIAAWQVVNRRELATAEQAEQFKQWCDTIATLGGAQYELLTKATWESFLDEAHSLLIGLDSVIVLKVSVPLVQLDLFAQSLLAARFTQSQEHWVYQEHAHSKAIFLERLWQQISPVQAAYNSQSPQTDQASQAASSQPVSADTVQNAVFQLIIDIPHLDSLEARKIYMRLRAVARASAAILQSAQGAHLSEGMLDRYSRELLLKQEALVKADVPPGSALAKAVFKPHLGMSSDLGF